MNKTSKYIKWIFVFLLIIAFVVGCNSIVVSSILPPDAEKMEMLFQRDKKDLSIIIDYFSDLDYSYIAIDKYCVENEVMFTGERTRYQEIDDKAVLKHIKKILKRKNYNMIVKDNNTIYFEKWAFIEKDRGIAFSVNNEELPNVVFLVGLESLSEDGWYYYEADYEEYRIRYGS